MELTTTPTSEQRVILLVGNWLKRYSQIYPMYGKTLSELPERMTEFLDEFRGEDPDELDRAFREVRGTCTEFPTPAAVRSQLKRAPERIRHEQMLAQSAEIVSRDAKPSGWRGNVTPEEIEAALQRGRLKAEINARSWNLAMDRPGKQRTAEESAATRNGASKVPTDPALRREYELACLRKNGWIEERQPGDDDE